MELQSVLLRNQYINEQIQLIIINNVGNSILNNIRCKILVSSYNHPSQLPFLFGRLIISCQNLPFAYYPEPNITDHDNICMM